MKKFFKPASYFSFIITFAIPTLIVCMALIFTSMINFNSAKSSVQNSVHSTLSHMSQLAETKILSVIETTKMVKNIPVLRKNLEDANAIADDSLIEHLNSIKSSYDFVDDIFIFNKNTDTICSSNGIYNCEDFFKNEYIYENYDYSYWNDFQFYKSTDYRILSPTIVFKGNKSDVILPIVFRRANDIHMRNHIIYNIKLSHIINFSQVENTFGSSIYLLNKYTNDVFSPSQVETIDLPEGLLKSLRNATSKSFNYNLDGKRVIVNSYSPNNTMIGYTYFSVTDRSVITNSLLPGIITTLMVIIFFLSCAFFTLRRNTNKLYTPLTNIDDILSNIIKDKNLSEKQNILESIISHAHNLQQLKNSYSLILPCAQERFIVNYLNSTDFYIDKDKNEFLKNSLPFPYDFYAVVVIRLTPTAAMFDLYNTEDYKNFQSGFYSIIKDIFSAKFPMTYTLPSDNETLYIILNFEKLENYNTIEELLAETYDLLRYDSEYIDIAIGKSDVVKGFDNLIKGHKEAINSLMPYFESSYSINLKTQHNHKYKFDSKMEFNLYSELISGNRNAVYTLLDNIFEQNADITPEARKQLYTSILNIILKIIRKRELPYNDNRLDFEILNDHLKQPLNKIHEKTMELINFVVSAIEQTTSKTEKNNISCIITYIQEHLDFADISLEYLANNFHMSPSNISLLIKSELGIGFHQYLTTLRINKAQKLLKETNKTIETISLECGFNSTQTFYRTFKKTTGQTPTVFRKNAL